MNILVTGASGFLGTALCARLEKLGHRVVGLNSRLADLRRPGALLPFNDVRYDQIFHLACWTQAGDFCLYHSGEQWIINQQINTQVLEFWQQHQPQAKLTAIGTSCAYASKGPMTEDQFLLGPPEESLFTYAMTKRMLYAGLIALQKQYGLRYLFVVPSTLYGPEYHTDGRQMHFIFDLIRKIIRGHYHGEKVVLWGDGHQKRELIHVEDFITAMLALTGGRDNELVNLGAGREHTIREFAEMICRRVGYDPQRIEYDTSRYVGARSKCLSIDKLRQLLPEFEPMPLETGLGQVIDWMLAHRDAFLR